MELTDYHAWRCPATPGHRGISTSIVAAEKLTKSLAHLQILALNAIKVAGKNGLTADELGAKLGMDRWSIQPRTPELKCKGLIKDSLQRCKNVIGKVAIVWVFCDG